MLDLIVIFVALAVIVAIFRATIDHRYRRELQAWATARGWVVREGGGEDWMSFLPAGRNGAGVKARLVGTWRGHPVSVADYWYRSTQAVAPQLPTTRTRHLTVVIFPLATTYPPVALRSRAFGGHRLGMAQAVGLRPANLTGVPEFDNRFRVETSAPGGGDLVTAQVIEATLRADLPPWQLRGHDLIIAWPGPFKVADLERRLGQALALIDLLDPVS